MGNLILVTVHMVKPQSVNVLQGFVFDMHDEDRGSCK